MSRQGVKVALVGGVATLVLAGGSVAAMAVATGSLRSGAVAGPGGTPATVSGSCSSPALPGTVVDVRLLDMGPRMRFWTHHRGGYPVTAGPVMDGPMMGSGPGYGGMMHGRLHDRTVPRMMGGRWPARMMQVRLSRHSVPTGTMSLRVTDVGVMRHELVVLPLAPGARVGQRSVGPDGTVDERASLGEVSRNCAAGSGEGLRPGGTGWTTLSLAPGRYELLCNLPGHYAAGMFSRLDVTR